MPLDQLGTTQECATRGSFKTAYWAKCDEIDWEAMAASAPSFDPATEVILAYIMVNSAVFTKIESEKKSSQYNFQYTRANDFYTLAINLLFEGKSAARRLTIKEAILECCIILHIFDNNGLERVVGMEWVGGTFTLPVERLKIDVHDDISGLFGGTIPSDALTLAGEGLFAPLYATVGEANIPV